MKTKQMRVIYHRKSWTFGLVPGDIVTVYAEPTNVGGIAAYRLVEHRYGTIYAEDVEPLNPIELGGE
jgi:hypothetical protein